MANIGSTSVIGVAATPGMGTPSRKKDTEEGNRIGNLGLADVAQDSKISFVCQRCLQPIRIDTSFYSMNEHVQAELTLPLGYGRSPVSPRHQQDTTDVSRNCDDNPTIERLVQPFQPLGSSGDATNAAARISSGATDHDFTLVGESGQPANVTTISNNLRMTVELFDLLSDNAGEVDHPLCEECTDTILETMDQQLKLSEEEAQQYHSFLQKLEGESEDDGSQVRQLQKELSDLHLEEESHREELADLKNTLVVAETDLSEQIKRRDELEKQEQKYWKEYSKYKRELLMAEDDFRSLDCQLRYAQTQMEKLRKTNVFSATFHVWHSGHFATINGFRLGRLPSVPVEWPEINAAWGQSALLLSCLSKTIGLDPFNKYQIVPYGSYSYIKVLADDKMLPLYGTGGFRMIFDTKYDNAMVAFLDCLSQFAAEVQRLGAFALPYEIDPKGKIRDNNSGQWYSIKLQFNSEDSWTKACRYMLTNLKWGLAYVGMTYMKQHPDNLDHIDSDSKGTASN